MKSKYAYTDDRDKSYGVTGVVMSLTMLHHDDKIHHVDLDAADGEYIAFTPDFYFYTNPRYSARIAWKETLSQYNLLVAMIMGNVMCRYRVMQNRPLQRETILDLRALIDEEGSGHCSLEKDEIDHIFNELYSYLSDVFSSSQVHHIVDNIASTLLRSRTLTGSEIAELIASMQR